MKKIRLLPLLAIFLWLSSCRITSAEDPGPPLASAEQITFQNQQVVATSSANGTFDPVTVNPLDAMNVQLQFPVTAAGIATVIQVMDGGLLGIGGTSAVNWSGWDALVPVSSERRTGTLSSAGDQQ